MGEGLLPKHGGYRHLKTFQIAEVIYDVTLRFCDRYVPAGSRTHDQMVQAARSGRQNLAEGSVDSATSKKIEMKLTGVSKGSLEELLLDYEDFLRQCGLAPWPPEHPALQRFRARRCASLADFRAWVREERQLLSAPAEPARGDTRQHGPEDRDTDKHGRTRTGASPGAEPGPAPHQAPGSAPHQAPGSAPCQAPGSAPCQAPGSAPHQAPGSAPCQAPGSAPPAPVRVRPCLSVSLPPPESLPASPAATRRAPPSAVIAANGALSLLNLCTYLVGRQVEAQAAAFERDGGFTERLYRQRQHRRHPQAD